MRASADKQVKKIEFDFVSLSGTYLLLKVSPFTFFWRTISSMLYGACAAEKSKESNR